MENRLTLYWRCAQCFLLKIIICAIRIILLAPTYSCIDEQETHQEMKYSNATETHTNYANFDPMLTLAIGNHYYRA